MRNNGGAPFFAVENRLIKREIRMDYVYNTSGVCSQQIHFKIENGVLRDVRFFGGCNGNLQGIGRLVEGLPAEEVEAKLKGVSCGGRPTSCPDQLAKAIRAALDSEKKG
jgi:uncharacterized protein (TIGR03905 family)